MLIDARTPPGGWVLILPLKGGAAAKSRLGGGPALARAIALDCLDAVLACADVARVLVVTADPATAADAAAAGADAVPESWPGSGLVAAVHDGLTAARRGPPGRPDGAWHGRTAVLLGDLPALRPADLSHGLTAAATVLAARPEAPMAVIPDAEGSGTVLLAARTPDDVTPAFGPHSLAGHRRLGAEIVVLDAPGPGLDSGRGRPDADPARLRHDVDTPADLMVALAQGVGLRTAALLGQSRSAS